MNKPSLLALALALLLVMPAAAQVRDIALNDGWRFLADSADHASGLPAEAVPVCLPHTYNVMPGLEDYAGRAWYERTLHVAALPKGRQLRLRFEAVYHDATVYVNGLCVGRHLGKGYTPFTVDVTRAVRAGQDNRLVVEVDNRYTDLNFPFRRHFDWANDGGIYRRVSLHESGPLSLRYAHFTPTLSLADSTGACHLSLRLWEPSVTTATFLVRLRSKHDGRVLYEGRHRLRRTLGGTFETDFGCGRVEPWHFDHPALYAFEVSVLDGRRLSDTTRGHIGFRQFGIRGNRFVLNGEPVRLPGVETMPGSNPDYGMAEPRDYVVGSARMLKDLNCTVTRFHWFQGDDMLNALDSLGILAQQELSWWQQPYKELSPAQRALAEETLAEMIEAHYNHPCIFAWAVSNEVKDNHRDVAALGAVIRRLDPSRLTETVGNSMYRYLERDPSLLLDIPTWNEYIGTWHGDRPRRREQLPALFDKIRPVLQGRPLFITEFGLCEPVFVGGDRRRTDDMLYHLTEWGKTDFVTGYIYFCLEDYRTQMGEEGRGKHRIRRHGVTDYRHVPKPSYYVLRDLMCPVEITKVQPATAVRDNQTLAAVWQAQAGDRAVVVGIRAKNGIPAYTLRGYTLRYTDTAGRTRVLALPVMPPGTTHDVTVPDMAEHLRFDLCRPDGGACLNY